MLSLVLLIVAAWLFAFGLALGAVAFSEAHDRRMERRQQRQPDSESHGTE